MPIENVFGWSMITVDYKKNEKYWNQLSDYVESNFNYGLITDPDLLQDTYKKLFNLLSDKFNELIDQQELASFFIYVHNFHENSIELWSKQLKGETLTINESEFVVVRRVLKIILEQSCRNKLMNSINYVNEILEKKVEFQEHIEELISIGYLAIMLSNNIVRSQLFPESLAFQNYDGKLRTIHFSPYRETFEFVCNDIPKHSDSVEIYNTLDLLKVVWKEQLGIDFNVIGGITEEQVKDFKYRGGVIKSEELKKLIVDQFGYDKNLVDNIYEGLTVSKRNVLSFEDCILRSQDHRRHLYRPIVELNIEGSSYWILGLNKWRESFTSLSTNALPFGICPIEWLTYDPIKKFNRQVEDSHDEILETPAVDLLNEFGYLNDFKIKSLLTSSSSNINLNDLEIGDIDIAFLNIEEKKVYICECKHNRFKHDLSGMRNDYVKFKKKYENQLERKVRWVRTNLQAFLYHFENKLKVTIESKEEYNVNGVFIINAPTIYMYNTQYLTFTLHSFEEFLAKSYVNYQFNYQNKAGENFAILNPLFDNCKIIPKE